MIVDELTVILFFRREERRIAKLLTCRLFVQCRVDFYIWIQIVDTHCFFLKAKKPE